MGLSKHGDLLLVCATAFEMRAALSGIPGGDACDLSRWERTAPLGQKAEDVPLLKLPGRGLRLLVCGVGPVAAALNLAGVLGGAPVGSFSGVVNLGIAGTYIPAELPTGSAVLVDAECFPEYGVWPESDELLREDAVRADDSSFAGMPLPLRFAQGSLPSGPVFARIPLDAHNALGNMGLNCHTDLHIGSSVTVSGVSGTERRARRLAALAGGSIENMEGFALALGAAASGLPFAEIRTVSNEAGRRPPHGWDMDAAVASLGRTARSLFAPLFIPEYIVNDSCRN